MSLKAIKAVPKTGDEVLEYNNTSTKYTLLDFWKWSVSDILSNATRGRFAEFIIGTAIDLDINELRDEWDAFDLTSKEGIKIEVKSSAYIQSWNQNEFSKISFSIKPAKYWEAENKMKRGEAKRYADVYTFCLLKHQNQDTINPLKLEQWEFYVLPTYILDNYTRSQSSISINSLKRLTSAINYSELKNSIHRAYKEQQTKNNKL